MRWANDLILEDRLVASKGFVVVAFLRCQSLPCKHYTSEFSATAEALKGEAEFLALEATENPMITEAYEVSVFPTTVVFRNGDEIRRYEGPYAREAIKKRLAGCMAEEKKKGV